MENPDEILAQGYAARRANRLEDAGRLFAEAVAQCRQSNRPAQLAAALKGVGQIERDTGDLPAALACYQEAAALYRTAAAAAEGDDPQQLALAHTIRHVADILQDAGRAAEAVAPYREALAIYRSHPQTPAVDLANAIRGFALLEASAGNRAQAIGLWQEARGLYSNASIDAGVAECERQLAILHGPV